MNRSRRGSRTWFISEVPTPQRTPTLNKLAAHLPNAYFVFMKSKKSDRGWGPITPKHPAVYWDALTLKERLSILWALTTRSRSEIAICFGYRGAPRIAAILTSRLFRSPVILRSDTNQQNVEKVDGPKRTIRRTLLRMYIPKSAIAWTIGTENERFWRQEIGLTQTLRIPYEVPVLPGTERDGRILPRISDPAQLRFLCVGRLANSKCFHDAIDAFRDLKGSKYTNWSLTIVGHGPDEARLKALAWGDPRIQLIGAVEYSELGKLYEAADVLVVPSSSEPWGLVVNEALGFGLYVIASDSVGAATDLVSEDDGAVYPTGDTGALSERMSSAARYTRRLPRPPQSDTAALMLEALGAR